MSKEAAMEEAKAFWLKAIAASKKIEANAPGKKMAYSVVLPPELAEVVAQYPEFVPTGKRPTGKLSATNEIGSAHGMRVFA